MFFTYLFYDKLDPRKTTWDYIILTCEFVMFLNYGIFTHKYIHSSSLGFSNTRNVNSINNINFTVTLEFLPPRSLKIFGDPITFNILVLQGLNKTFPLHI